MIRSQLSSSSSFDFLNRLDETDVPLLFDGAMGTMIHGRGVSFTQSFESLNLKDPALIAEIHRAYIDNGADIIITNTFGANRYRLAKHGLGNQLRAINRAGVDLARRVIEASFKDILLAGDIGPLGVRLAPFGRVQPIQARDAFREQIEALVDEGVDLLVIETFSDLNEIRQAIEAATELCDLPILASVSFSRDDRTLLGESPIDVARTLHELNVSVIGINCSTGPSQILRILTQMRSAVPGGKFSVMPNAGLPEQVEGRIMYPASPHYFGEYALAFRRAGAAIIGGCCGTTPEHIAMMRAALDSPYQEQETIGYHLSIQEQEEEVFEGELPTQLARRLSDKKFVVSVEMDPPRGFGTQKLQAAASLLAEAGADVVSVADNPMARMRMSPWAVCSLIQNEVGLETTLHFPTRGRNLLRVQGDLLAAHALNVRNVFVVMGDPTAVGDYPDAIDDYDVVPSGLIKLIKQNFNVGKDYSGYDIGQPTSFFVGCALNLTPKNIEREIKVFHRKVSSGADFALTQPVYDPLQAKDFVNRVVGLNEKPPLYVLVGILPLHNVRHASFLHHEVPGITIPEKVLFRIENAGNQGWGEGAKIAIELIEQISEWADGIYLMPPFGRYDVAADIIENI